MDFVMTSDCKYTITKEHNEETLGLVSGHSYTLISAHELDYNGGVLKLVKLRNPVKLILSLNIKYVLELINFKHI